MNWPAEDLRRLVNLGYNPTESMKFLIVDIERACGLFPHASCLRRLTPIRDEFAAALPAFTPPVAQVSAPITEGSSKRKRSAKKSSVQHDLNTRAISESSVQNYQISFDSVDGAISSALSGLRSFYEPPLTDTHFLPEEEYISTDSDDESEFVNNMDAAKAASLQLPVCYSSAPNYVHDIRGEYARHPSSLSNSSSSSSLCSTSSSSQHVQNKPVSFIDLTGHVL